MTVYRIPHAAWKPSPGLQPHDLEGARGRRIVRVEARARTDGNNLATAIAQVHAKFPIGNFTNTAGIVVSPYTHNAPNTPEVVIVDPVGVAVPRDHNELRTILEHYLPFFEYQGERTQAFTTRLRELSASTPSEFERYLREGDVILRQSLPNRTFFRVRGERFLGTAWSDIAWPSALTGMPDSDTGGFFYWGLWERVIQALRDGRVEEIARMRVVPGTVRHRDITLMILEDGSGLAWAPTQEQLRPDMFADLPDSGEWAR